MYIAMGEKLIGKKKIEKKKKKGQKKKIKRTVWGKKSAIIFRGKDGGRALSIIVDKIF